MPLRKASACTIVDGEAIIRLDQACLEAVDIDGQMDSQDANNEKHADRGLLPANAR